MHQIHFSADIDMNEFIFGHLATPQQRLERTRQRGRGVCHHYQIEPIAPQPNDTPSVTVDVGVPFTIERVECHIIAPQPQIVPLRWVDTHWDALNWQYVQVWQTQLPRQAVNSVVRYHLLAYPERGGEPLPADDGVTFSYYVGNPCPPAWTAEAIIYQIFPDRFYPGHGRAWRDATALDDIFGGTLRGIIDQLDYIADMGFNCLWLNPFFPDDTHHGYHAYDYFNVNPRLGTLDDIRELLDRAHSRQMRVILDFVANHWGHRHATFQDARQRPDSPYRDWYYWLDWPHDYHTFFGVRELPQLNVDHPAVRAHLLKSVAFWSEVGFDGYRLDYALGPSHDFWTAFRAAVKQHSPEAWLFGEAVDTPDVILSYRGRFDGCLDFTLLQALRDTFAFGTMDIAQFDTFLNQHEIFFPADFSRPSFLDNHDMNRFLWLAKGNKQKLKLAALCQFTLSGSPIVYYGTEVGLSQRHDVAYSDGRHVMEESRLPMLWGEAQDADLRDYYRWLIHFRRQHPVLWRGQRRTVLVDAETQTYGYVRQDERESLLVLFNLSEVPQTLTAVGQTSTLAPLSGRIVVLDSPA